MKNLLLLLFLTLFPVNPAHSQDTTTAPTWEKRDHAQNRLFWMSTGRISTPEKFSIGNFEIFALQAGYTPTDFLQFNTSAAFSLYSTGVFYWSVGAKAQIFASDSSFVQGLSVGTDMGFYAGNGSDFSEFFEKHLQAFNIAGSFGMRNVQLHINVMGFTDRRQFMPVIQIGGSFDIERPPNSRGVKLIAECLMMATDAYQLKPITGAVGIRSYGKTLVAEFALMYLPYLGHGSGFGTIFPYISAMWYF